MMTINFNMGEGQVNLGTPSENSNETSAPRPITTEANVDNTFTEEAPVPMDINIETNLDTNVNLQVPSPKDFDGIESTFHEFNPSPLDIETSQFVNIEQDLPPVPMELDEIGSTKKVTRSVKSSTKK